MWFILNAICYSVGLSWKKLGPVFVFNPKK